MLSKRSRAHLLAAAMSGVMSAGAGAAGGGPKPAPAERPVARHVVTTTGGQLSGYEANASTWQFIGIPYARPPLGDLRWRPPQKAEPWSGVRDAVAWPDQSAQDPRLKVFGEGGMSEDSLYLHVTTPKDAKALPVMVWFHGGAFTILSNNSKQYNNPAGLTTKGVVLVTVNHRLGPFGYLSHPLLSAESGYKGSGNYGQMDLIMALQWVRDNIAAFGGDPRNVTLFGQSGGGGKVYSLMNSPLATGLFHKAVVQSGATPIPSGGTPASSLAANEAIGIALFKRLGVTTLEEARALPWTAIVQADIDHAIPRETYRPNVDHHVLPKTYAQNVAEGMPSDVPLLVGVTSGDYGAMRMSLPYFLSQRTPSYKSPQFVYKFSRVPDGWREMGLLSVHSGELPYLFNDPQGHLSNFALGLVLLPDGSKPPIDRADVFGSMKWGVDDVATAELTMTMWTQFAKTGNPSTAELQWPAYTIANDSFVEIGPAPTATVRSGVAAAMR